MMSILSFPSAMESDLFLRRTVVIRDVWSGYEAARLQLETTVYSFRGNMMIDCDKADRWKGTFILQTKFGPFVAITSFWRPLLVLLVWMVTNTDRAKQHDRASLRSRNELVDIGTVKLTTYPEHWHEQAIKRYPAVFRS